MEGVIVIASTIATYLFAYKEFQWSILIIPIATIFVLALLIFLRNVALTPRRIYKENKEKIKQLNSTIETLKDSISPKLIVTFEKGNNPCYRHQGRNQEGYEIYIYRIGIKNIGLETVEDVQGVLEEIEPCPEYFAASKSNLHWMHDNIEPFNKYERLQAGQEKFIDIMYYFRNGDNKEAMQITHIARGVGQNIEVQNYKLKIFISSKNGGDSILKELNFCPNRDIENMLELVN